MTSARASWADVLDELDQRLDAASATLESPGTPSVDAFVVPDVDEPLPDALRARAQSALDRGDELLHRLEAEADRIRADLARLPRRPPPATSASRFAVDA